MQRTNFRVTFWTWILMVNGPRTHWNVFDRYSFRSTQLFTMKNTKTLAQMRRFLDVKEECNFKKWILLWLAESSKLRRSQFSNEILIRYFNFFCQNREIAVNIDWCLLYTKVIKWKITQNIKNRNFFAKFELPKKYYLRLSGNTFFEI